MSILELCKSKDIVLRISTSIETKDLEDLPFKITHIYTFDKKDGIISEILPEIS